MEKVTEQELKIAYDEYKFLCERIHSGNYSSFDLDMVDLLHVWITAVENALQQKTNTDSPNTIPKQDG